MPRIDVNPYYNPFNEPSEYQKNIKVNYEKLPVTDHWEALYNFNGNISTVDNLQQELPGDHMENRASFTFQLKNKYILTNVKSGLMIIDQKRAHERILFEHYMDMIKSNQGVTQKSLFPKTIDLTVNETNCLMEIFTDISALGFDIEFLSDTQIIINGYPPDTDSYDPVKLIKQIIASFTEETLDIETGRIEKIAKEMAVTASIHYGKILKNEEMKDLVDHLFACETPNYSPSGKLIISILNLDEIEHRF